MRRRLNGAGDTSQVKAPAVPAIWRVGNFRGQVPTLFLAPLLMEQNTSICRMRVPCRARARLERNAGADRACRSDWLKQRVNAHRAGEPIRRTFAGRLRTASFDFHFLLIPQVCVKSRKRQFFRPTVLSREDLVGKFRTDPFTHEMLCRIVNNPQT